MRLLPFELDRTLRQAEDFLRRHVKSKAVREAEKRQRERRAREAGRRFKRAVTIGGVSGAGVFCAGAAAISAGPALGAAGAAALATMVAALIWPRQRATDGPLSSAELEALPAEAEEWLLGRRRELPGAAAAPVDAILRHLADLQGALGTVNPASTLAWDARRLIGDHLPRLVHCYCVLPSVARDEDKELRRRLVDGLGTIAEELGRLSLEVNRDRLMHFETQGRFLESKYRDPVS
jgi:hypothetical protein